MPTEPGGSPPKSNRTTLQHVRVANLKDLPDEARRFSKLEKEIAREVVRQLPPGAPIPILANGQFEILDGIEFVDAARDLGIETVYVVIDDGMTPLEQRQLRVAIDQLQSRGSWDPKCLEAWVRLFEREIENFDHLMLGFDNGELDKILGIPARILGGEDDLPPPVPHAVSSIGTMWQAGTHRVLVGSATNMADYVRLMDGKLAGAAFPDPPYGCGIDGFVSTKGKHRDFVEGAGDKNPEELLQFFTEFGSNISRVLRPGALLYAFIDWRSQHLLQSALRPIFGELTQFVCWAKDRGGLGGRLYRSQHELVLVYRKAGAKHINAVQLGKHGRNRSNLWSYPCAASSRSGREGDMLKHHPTPKPVEMIADAILDCTHPGDIVLDCFLGSGTTLIAAERTGRCCYALELDPLYADLAIRRWQNWTRQDAIDVETGCTFNELENTNEEEDNDND
jgi:DNA modification methylase